MINDEDSCRKFFVNYLKGVVDASTRSNQPGFSVLEVNSVI